jgi:hypothetical protein
LLFSGQNVDIRSGFRYIGQHNKNRTTPESCKESHDSKRHIINELLDLLVQSNATACALAEVEGDALLFYRKGEPIPPEVVAAMLQNDQASGESFKAFCESHA